MCSNVVTLLDIRNCLLEITVDCVRVKSKHPLTPFSPFARKSFLLLPPAHKGRHFSSCALSVFSHLLALQPYVHYLISLFAKWGQ